MLQVSTSELGHTGAGDFTSDIVTINTSPTTTAASAATTTTSPTGGEGKGSEGVITVYPAGPVAFIARGWTAMAKVSDDNIYAYYTRPYVCTYVHTLQYIVLCYIV